MAVALWASVWWSIPTVPMTALWTAREIDDDFRFSTAVPTGQLPHHTVHTMMWLRSRLANGIGGRYHAEMAKNLHHGDARHPPQGHSSICWIRWKP